MGFKIVKTERKKKKIQHTKIILDIIIALTIITIIASIYINYKNGFSMDGVVTAIIDMLKWVVPSGLAKSVFETKEEKKMRLEYLKAGMINEYESRDV